MAKDQLEWPRTRVVYQIKVGPTVPQTLPANIVPPVWPRLEDNRCPFNRCELGIPLGMPSGNLNSSRIVVNRNYVKSINSVRAGSNRESDLETVCNGDTPNKSGLKTANEGSSTESSYNKNEDSSERSGESDGSDAGDLSTVSAETMEIANG
ncbi:hypothetical protein SUGI_0565620 [Cryptomeria japonica]|nr:hypothetical protein SUGI_0565620 [Cryptomeria japonica]